MTWLKFSSVGFGTSLLCVSACGSGDLEICDPGTSWSHDLAACVAGDDDGTGMRDDSVMTPDGGVPALDGGAIDAIDGAAPVPDAGALHDAEAPHDAAVFQDAALVDAAIIDAAPPEDAGDAQDASNGGVCTEGDTELSSCGLNDRGELLLQCLDGQWHEASACNDPDECVDGTTEMVPCDRVRPGHRRCIEGHWREPSCMPRRIEP